VRGAPCRSRLHGGPGGRRRPPGPPAASCLSL
jgi:hypothetical protein